MHMSLSQLLVVLRARYAAALLLVAALVAAVAGVSLWLPKQYTATAAVLIDARSADPVSANSPAGYGTTSSYMATQIDLIQSERVALRALRALNLQNDPAWQALWLQSTAGRGEKEPWLAEQLMKRLEVRPSRESSVVNIGYVAGDAAFAAAAANAVVRAYVDTTLDLKVEPARQYNSFFDQRAAQLRKALEDAQGRLTAYQQARGIVATDERLDVENARLAELSSQVVILQGLAAESTGRRSQAGSNSQEVLSNVLIGNLTADLARQEARLNEMRQRLGERHPQVIELASSVDQSRSRLDSETRRVSSSLGVNSNVDLARLNSAQAALAAQRARVLKLRGERGESSVLQRDVDSAQRAYEAALARLTQTGLESQATFTNVSVLKTASPPPVPSGPRVLLNSAVAGVVGLLLAIGFVLLRESGDRRLRFDSDVTEALQQPLLVRIPSPRGGPMAGLTLPSSRRLDWNTTPGSRA